MLKNCCLHYIPENTADSSLNLLMATPTIHRQSVTISYNIFNDKRTSQHPIVWAAAVDITPLCHTVEYSGHAPAVRVACHRDKIRFGVLLFESELLIGKKEQDV